VGVNSQPCYCRNEPTARTQMGPLPRRFAIVFMTMTREVINYRPDPSGKQAGTIETTGER
jgi:hypothetical protein